MRCKMCVNGDALQLVEGLDADSMAYKRTDVATPSYRSIKSIYGQVLF
jgi:hypothetical protein